MRRTITATFASVFVAGAVFAHSGVENQVVLERMTLMEDISDQLKVIGGMAQGRMDFDAERAAEAQSALVAHAGDIPAAFEPEEMDPESEALPAIWEDWGDFVGIAEQLETAAADLSTDSLDDLRAGLQPIGNACGACHEDYRVDD